MVSQDEGSQREDKSAPGEWPGSGTTVDGKVETATTGIGGNPDAGSGSTSAPTQNPDDTVAEKA